MSGSYFDPPTGYPKFEIFTFSSKLSAGMRGLALSFPHRISSGVKPYEGARLGLLNQLLLLLKLESWGQIFNVVIKCYCPSGIEICLTLRGRHEIKVESRI